MWWYSEVYKEKNYHIEKIKYFNNIGIKIINIWEDWWKYKNEIIKSIIENKLNYNKNKIYARCTKIKEIESNSQVKEFLNKNHLQGYTQSKYKIGLFYNNELVSIMTFGKRRIALGKKSSDNNEYELIRFCNKLNTNVIGGASKLFNFFINNINTSKITSYADLSISEGDLYKKIGMRYISTTSPNYTYFNKDIRMRLNRFNFRKDILIRNGYNKNNSEHDIMNSRGYYRIYDCGNLSFEYKKTPD